MKLSPTGACFRILSLCALLFGACCGTRGQAGQTFTYAGGDLLIGLRQTAGYFQIRRRHEHEGEGSGAFHQVTVPLL